MELARAAAETPQVTVTEVGTRDGFQAEWLKSIGWKEWQDAADELYEGTLYIHCGSWLGWDRRLVWILGSIEIVRIHEDGQQVSESVTLLGNPATKTSKPTRGQLSHLLKALEIESKSVAE